MRSHLWIGESVILNSKRFRQYNDIFGTQSSAFDIADVGCDQRTDKANAQTRQNTDQDEFRHFDIVVLVI